MASHLWRDNVGFECHYDAAQDLICTVGIPEGLGEPVCYALSTLFRDDYTGQTHTGDWIRYWWLHQGQDPDLATGVLLDSGLGGTVDAIESLTTEINNVVSDIGNVAASIPTQITNAIGDVAGAISAIGTDITNAISGIESTISNEVNIIGDNIQAVIETIDTQVTHTINGLGDDINNTILGISTDVQDVVNSVGNDLNITVAAAEQSVATAVTSIGLNITDTVKTLTTDLETTVEGVGLFVSDAITNALNAFLPQTLGAITTAEQQIQSLLSTLNDSIKTPEQWVAGLAAALDARYDELKARVTDVFGVALPAGLAETLAVLDVEASDTVDPLLHAFAATPNLPPNLANLLSSIGSPGSPLAYIGKIIALGGILAEVVGPMLSPLMRPGGYIVENQARTKALSLGEAIEAQKRGYIDSGEMLAIGGIEGYEDRLTQIMASTARELLSPMEYISLWRRGAIADSALSYFLGKLGLDGEQQGLLRTSSEYVPTTTDVLVWLTRDVFIPEFRQRFRMDEEFPNDSLPLFHALGISDTNARNFWAGHWELPSIEQGYLMYRRLSSDASIATGEGIQLPDGSTRRRIIGRDDLLRLLRAHGVEPFWRDKQVAVSFHPLTRVDLRRMFAAGSITQSDVFAGYIALGYDDATAHALTDFAVRLAADAARVDEAPWKTGLKAHVVSGLEAGWLTEQEATEHLNDIGFTSAQQDFFIHESRFIETITARKSLTATVKKFVVSGLWTLDRATTELRDDGVSTTAINNLLHDWTLEKEYADEHKALTQHKELTRAQIITAYREAIISATDARVRLVAIGWSDAEASVILSEADYQTRQATAALVKTATRDLYVAGRLSRADASTRLDNLQTSAAQRDALLDAWDIEILRQIPKLPLPLLEKMVGEQLLTHDDAHDELISQHYTERETSLLLALWGDEIAAAAEKQRVADAKAAAAAALAAATAAEKALIALAPSRVFLTTKQIFDAYDGTTFTQTDVRVFLLLNKIVPIAVERLMVSNLGTDYRAPQQSLADIDAEVLRAFGPNQTTLRDNPLQVEQELKRYFGG